jgi:hypothetical protein
LEIGRLLVVYSWLIRGFLVYNRGIANDRLQVGCRRVASKVSPIILMQIVENQSNVERGCRLQVENRDF